jgi:hypothetical protein
VGTFSNEIDTACSPSIPSEMYLPIIRTSLGHWVSPQDAIIVPPSLKHQGLPLFNETELNCGGEIRLKYVNALYTSWDTDSGRLILETLGAKTLSAKQVRTILSSSAVSFSEKDVEWLTILFEYLHAHPEADPLDVPFLKLEGGKWVSAQVGTIYWPHKECPNFDLARLHINLLDYAFYLEISKNDVAMQYLTQRLGIGPIHVMTIVKAIFACHDEEAQARISLDTTSRRLDKKTCIDHANYLWQHRDIVKQNENARMKKNFYVVTHRDKVERSEYVVLDRTITVGERRKVPLSNLSIPTFAFLSPSYHLIEKHFLTEYFGVKPLLPLTELPSVAIARAEDGTSDDPTRYTSRFHSIYTDILSPAKQANNLLLHYFGTIWDEIPLRERQGPLLIHLKSLRYHCENGQLVPLTQTFLRTPQTSPHLIDGMNVLQVHSPGAPKWYFLKDLGVTTKPNLELFVQRLKALRTDVIDGREITTILQTLYGDVVRYVQQHPGETDLLRCLPHSRVKMKLIARSRFIAEELLLASYGSTGKLSWSSPDRVYLDCPAFIKSGLAPCRTDSTAYKSLRDLLKLPHWDLKTRLLDDLKRDSQTRMSFPDWQKYLLSVLEWIDTQGGYKTKAGTAVGWLADILELPIFPVTTKSGVQTRHGRIGPGVVIPNSTPLFALIQGKVDVLDFGKNPRLKKVIRVLRCAPRAPTFLSSFESTALCIKPIGPMAIDICTTRAIWNRRLALTRYVEPDYKLI